MERLNKYGFCLDPITKYTMMDNIGQHFLECAIKLVKTGYKFIFVLDNIDWEEKVHNVRSDNQNKSVHAVATSIVFYCVPIDNLPDDGPQRDLKTCNVRDIIPISNTELDVLKVDTGFFWQDFSLNNLPEFRIFEAHIPCVTYCKYSEQTCLKSEVITMPILLKDEKKYSDCVDVLDQLENWTYKIYSAARLCNVVCQHTTPPIGNRSRPDQPASHFPPVTSSDDPMAGVKIPCYGDQLTRVRLAGSKDLRAGCHSASQQLDHLYPFCIVDWHTKRSFLKLSESFELVLQTVFKRLYKNSGREKGTLRYFHETLNRRNVTVDVKHYKDCEQLFLSIGMCFVVEAFLEFFDMDDEMQKPLKNAPNLDASTSDEQKKIDIKNFLDKFLDQYIFVAEDEEDPPFVNWNGGERKNVEIDLFQENRNKDMKAMIKAMGANKSVKAISRASKAAGGVKKIVEAYEKQVPLRRKYLSHHAHKSSVADEKMIMADLRSVRPFNKWMGEDLNLLGDISHNPASPFDEDAFVTWVNRHKSNILKHFPVSEDDSEEDTSSETDD
ncbi:Hypothetical predicted protein [Paramuricea clavata]|uniref:DUF6589 domain-containing protein n=1 Tax=Paramuricea clavata TaxID=317549 RepID=A0A7D9DCP2_PARCT|nr:Hypothetical predicted protein [Paramuricea clavata]